jgi:alkylhydroperoxidase family enzyme
MREFARLPKPPARESVAAAERADYDLVSKRIGKLYDAYDVPSAYFGALLNAPPLAAAIVRLGRMVREGELRGSYTDAERELVDIVLGVDLDYNGIFTVHIPDAIAVGVRPEAIEALRSGEESKLTDDERQIADYSRQVVSGTVTDESYAALQERMGERGALEFTVFVGFLLMVFRLWQALGVPDPSDGEIDQLVRDLVTGAIETPDPGARIG